MEQLNNEISLKELIEKLLSICKYLLSKWFIIGMFSAMGAVIGFFMAWSKPIKYTARISFVAEGGKSSISGLSSLVGQFGLGLDIEGSNSGGIFAGENLLVFLKSEGLIRETLLTRFDSSSNATLADKYADIYGYKKEWLKNKEIGAIDFSPHRESNLPRKQDSLLQLLVGAIANELAVSRTDKKATFVEVKTTMRDELLCKVFTERLVQTGTERYIQSKIKIKAANVAILQKKADSLGALLNRNTYSAAAAQQQLVDINPALRTAPVAAEISNRDKMMIATIFTEVIKNLELAKYTLQQETPSIYIVDKTYLPLKIEKVSELLGLLLGGILAGFLAIGCILVSRWWRYVMVIS